MARLVTVPVVAGVCFESAGILLASVRRSSASVILGYCLVATGAALCLWGCRNWIQLKKQHWAFILCGLVPPGLLPILLLEYRLDEAELEDLIERARNGELDDPSAAATDDRLTEADRAFRLDRLEQLLTDLRARNRSRNGGQAKHE